MTLRLWQQPPICHQHWKLQHLKLNFEWHNLRLTLGAEAMAAISNDDYDGG